MGRKPDKYVRPLNQEDRETLGYLRDYGETRRIRHRAHAVLLSDQGKPVTEIAEIFSVDRQTVSQWLDRWEEEGVEGLADEHRPGGPRTLTESEEKQVLRWLDQHPHGPKTVLKKIEEKFGKRISARTLRRIARRSGRTWKRMRRSLKSKRDEEAFRQAQDDLEDLKEAHEDGELDLWYMDAAGFSLDPPVPYGWQPVGNHRELPAERSRQLNTIGFLAYDTRFVPYTFEGAIDSECVIACIDAFSRTLTHPTVVVVDNASVHTSAAVTSRLAAWEDRGLFFYFLPPYCPELNLIEVLWRMIKYHWLPLGAYDTFKKLKQSVHQLFAKVGREYRLDFG